MCDIFCVDGQSQSDDVINRCMDKLKGVPCVGNQRLPVANVLGAMIDAADDNECLWLVVYRSYPDITHQQLRAVLEYAIEAVDDIP